MNVSESIENTSLYSIDDFEDSLVSSTLKEVCEALKEKGYNEINQYHKYMTLTLLQLHHGY